MLSWAISVTAGSEYASAAMQGIILVTNLWFVMCEAVEFLQTDATATEGFVRVIVIFLAIVSSNSLFNKILYHL